MPSRKVLSKIACLSVAAALLSCGAAPGKSVSFRYTEMRAKLDNGLKFVIIPDKSAQALQVDIRYAVGSNQDPEGKAGLAHFLEHMMFQWQGEPFWGEGNPGPMLFKVMPQLVVGFNAYTNWDTTHYYLQGTTKDLKKFLDLEARRMKMAIMSGKADCSKQIPTVPAAEFEREREVVRNEIRWRSGDADGQILQTLMDMTYPEGHPYHQMIGGNDMQLASITPQDVCDFFGNYYMPANATVIVAGNVDADETAKLIQGYFGPLQNGELRKLDPIEKVKLKYEKKVVELDVESPRVSVVWALPDMDSEDWPAANTMLNNLIGRAAYFVEEWGIARDIDIALLGGRHAPIFAFTAVLYKEEDIDAALDSIWQAAEGAHRGTEGLSMAPSDVIKEVKDSAKARLVSSLESLATRTGMVADMIQFSTKTSFDSKNDYLLEAFKQIDQLDEGSYKSFIKREMVKDKAKVLIVKRNPNIKGGDKRAQSMFQGDPHSGRDVSTDPAEANRPLAYPDEPSILNQAERYELKNGLKVVLMPTNSMPIAHIELHFGSGSAWESADKAGVASMAASRIGNIETRQAMSTIGVQLYGQARMDETVFTARGTSNYMREALKGLERTLVAGDIEQDPIEKWQERFADSLKLPSVRAREAWSMEMSKAVYGPEHAWTLKGSPLARTYKNIGRDAAKDFADKHFVAKNGTLIVVGSFDAADAKKMIQEIFGEFRSGKAAESLDFAFQASGKKAIGVAKKESPQTDISIQYRGPVGLEPDKYAARLILGEILNQRMAKMRTKLGSTYGAYAGIGISKGPRVYQMGGAFDTARVGESLAAMREQIDDLREGNGFELDFINARRVILTKLLGESTESYFLAARLARIALFGLSPDFYDNILRDVATMTPDRVRAVLNQDIVPENEVIGIYGDKATLEKAFPEAGIDYAEIIDPNE